MTVYRHEEQQYADVAALIAETLSPTENDVVYIKSINRPFRWVSGSTATHDGYYVIDQTSETANGRWLSLSVANVYTGTGTTSALANGQTESIDITVTGAKIDRANLVAVTNGDDFAAGLFVISKEVIAADTVRIVVQNETGGSVSATALEVSVLEF